MRGSSDRPENRNPLRASSGQTSRKPYRPPRLTRYGSLSKLALGPSKGGTKNDGAAASKA